ncbi:MAG: HAD family phosphatase [Fibrobacter sp.]|nr:HAD family phosphatase [Fibrobacter sp.]
MTPKLFAFDLDGTLLNSEKKLSPKNNSALEEMIDNQAIVAFASGRLGSSMQQYICSKFDLPMLTLNGAAVYMGKKHDCKLIYNAPLSAEFADYLINYSDGKNFGLNYYIDDKLFTVRSAATAVWQKLYVDQTSTVYHYLSSFDQFQGRMPSKVLFVGAPDEIDRQEEYFRNLWGDTVYICRTWDHYLEFLNPAANKGIGLEVLADAYGVEMKDVAAFGDALNDIPMLQAAGMGIAVSNALPEVKNAASKVSIWSNDEDVVAMEWEEMRRKEGSA